MKVFSLTLPNISTLRLFLQVKVSSKVAGSVKLSISSPYWIVNKAGIPLIFRQEGVQQEAAGIKERQS